MNWKNWKNWKNPWSASTDGVQWTRDNFQNTLIVGLVGINRVHVLDRKHVTSESLVIIVAHPTDGVHVVFITFRAPES